MEQVTQVTGSILLHSMLLLLAWPIVAAWLCPAHNVREPVVENGSAAGRICDACSDWCKPEETL